jgi:aspartyl-tRNA(Asn)/glutamyl-tRNA(Gln) amidotransferase subunit C
MSSIINKESLIHLTKLARIELTPAEEEKLLDDLQKILDHFEELKRLDTSLIEPMKGGSSLKNVLRDDESRENTNQSEGVKQFPENWDKFLKVPPVF